MNRRRLALLAVAAVLVLLFGGRWVALRYTDALWFESMGQAPRYRELLVRAVLWQLATIAVAFAWFAGHTLGVYASIGAVHLPRRLGNIEIDEAVPQRILRGIALAMAGLLAFATAYTFNDLHSYIAVARGVAPFGVQDPVLHQDAAFYLAVLPLLEMLHLLATVLALLAALLVVALYAITGSLAISRRRLRITPHARTHLVVLLAVLALVIAWGFQLDAWQLVAGGGHAAGTITPTDRAIRIPASNLLAIGSLMVAIITVLALRWVRPLMLTLSWAALAGLTLIVRLLIPVMTEAWGAAADPALVTQVAQETEDFSRQAFGVRRDLVPERPLPVGDVKPESAAAFTQALEGLYAWSGTPEVIEHLLDDAVGDTSGLRLWWLTPTVARDASGRAWPAALATWQTNATLAQRTIPRPNWTRLHREELAWGGEPIALEATPRAGGPTWLAHLDPADTLPRLMPVPLAIPRIRFLPQPAELAVVGPRERVAGDLPPGVPLRGMFRRLMLAWALQAPPLLDEHTSNADRVLYWRDVPTRLALLYPFAGFDPPRAAIVDGRLLWIADGYLSSGRFPLSAPIHWRGDDINYLASPYIVTIDAVSGETRFYLRPLAGAFAASIARASQLSPLPAESIPAGVRAALRYPEALLTAQAQMLGMTADHDVHNGWTPAWPDTAAVIHDAGQLHATLAVSTIDGAGARPWAFVPLVDPRASQLAALAAGGISAGGDLQLLLLRVAGGGAVTPREAATRMSNAPAVMAANAYIGGADNGLRRGPVLVLPAGGTTAFAQLLFTAGHQGEPVRVQGLAVLAGNRGGFGADVKSATRSLMRGDSTGLGAALAGAGLGDARAAFLSMDSARQAGDWEKFGLAITRLRHALRLDAAPAPAPSGGPRP